MLLLAGKNRWQCGCLPIRHTFTYVLIAHVLERSRSPNLVCISWASVATMSKKKITPGHITGDVNDVSPVFRGRNFGANLPVLGQFACPLHMERWRTKKMACMWLAHDIWRLLQKKEIILEPIWQFYSRSNRGIFLLIYLPLRYELAPKCPKLFPTRNKPIPIPNHATQWTRPPCYQRQQKQMTFTLRSSTL